jgi:crossover junction endodeoxyribonuclease RuvC
VQVTKPTARVKPVRVLGVDPGLTRCGIGVVDGPAGRPVAVAASCVRTDRDAPIERRLAAIHEAVAAALAEHEPDVLACERVLFSSNARTAMGVGQAAGVALLAAAEAGVPVRSYSPNEVKLSVAGDGAADKTGVARMVASHLRLASPPRPADVADALAVALCHLSRAAFGDAVGDATATGWASVLERPHVRIAGGTGDPR